MCRQTDRQFLHKKIFRSKYYKGFTLAEVLVTLAIIGVVSAITIPSLVTSIQNQRYTAALQKNYSVIARAYLSFQADGNDIKAAFPGTNLGAAALTKIAPYFNIIKNCGSGMGCWYNSPRYHLNKDKEGSSDDIDTYYNTIGGKAILADGTMIFVIDGLSTKCSSNSGTGPLLNSVCGQIWIDINGYKGPNTYGRDVFAFYIAKTGVYPWGSNGDARTCSLLGDGYGCANRVITQGMNY
jgi:prepilin-type N-terminal cleavage/methylation domain-containing protein